MAKIFHRVMFVDGFLLLGYAYHNGYATFPYHGLLSLYEAFMGFLMIVIYWDQAFRGE